jgi:hypothetical protein
LSDEATNLVNRAKAFVRSILHDSLHMQPSEGLYILYDEGVELTEMLTATYGYMADEHSDIEFTNFKHHTPDDILAHLQTLKANACVILVQSRNFV